LNQQTASTIAVINSGKQFISGTTGSGISLSSDVLALDINGLSEETAIDRNADYIAIYDASTGTTDKTKPANLALGITLQGISNVIDPDDNGNYFIGAIPAIAGTTADINRIYVPKSGIVKAVNITFYNGVTGSNESSTMYLKVNATTLVNLGTVQNNATTTTLLNSSLNTPVTYGDYIELKWDCPTWVTTNPEDVYISYVVYME
jgi:hypothetical protein